MTMNTNRMIELALVFFVSLLSFSIGTYVGKKYSDNQHRLAQLEPKSETKVHAADVVDHGTESTEASHTTATEKTATMTDAEVAKLAEEFATEEEPAAHTKNIAEVAEHSPAKTATAETLHKIKETKDIKEIPPTSVAKAAPAQTAKDLSREVASISEKAKTMGAVYTVQVGAYPTSADAEKMTESLKARGYKASSVEALVNGKMYYRVQVGLFDNLQEAQEYKKELVEKNRLSSAFIQKIQQ
jgi:cell division protein FtsN